MSTDRKRPRYALLSLAGNTASLCGDDDLTVTLAVDRQSLDMSIAKKGIALERVTVVFDNAAGSFKTSVIQSDGKRSEMTGKVQAGCVAVSYIDAGDAVFAFDVPLAILPETFAKSIAVPRGQPNVPELETFFAELNSNPYLREQVMRFAARGEGPFAIDFCDAVCAMCWASGGTQVHACLACIFCNGFTTAPPTAP